MHSTKPPPHHHPHIFKKSNSNNINLFLCLKPVVVEDLFANPKGGTSSNSVFKFFDMERKDDVIFPRVYSAPEFTDSAANHPKKKSKRRFLRVVKAVFFETSLAKKIKRRTSMKKKKHSNGETLSKVDKDLNLVKEKLLQQKKFFDGTSVASTMSSSVNSTASSINSSTRFVEKGTWFGSFNPIGENNKKKQETMIQEDGKGHYGSNTGLFLLLVTLLVLVLWGKIFAILCTSTWLFFVPNWSSISGRKSLKISKIHGDSPEMEENKKKIIMEGFLERNRNRLL
ncbi:uncharacterized protein LOC126667444 [Mercurialis annua]|uniref:uncharacterized protein LOC126667444 n=1 Tax=Mercurialis annua TaxID=3986 RepID=UPI00215F8084|nr:uncharacterized protein LOC126667444 [Mercurialis annua]